MARKSKAQPRAAGEYRLKRLNQATLKPQHARSAAPRAKAVIDCGWGRLIFAHTFDDPQDLTETLRAEGPDRRDIAFYVREPQVIISMAPQELFIDPSLTYRLDLTTYRPARRRRQSYSVRRLIAPADVQALNTIFAERGMVRIPESFFDEHPDGRVLSILVAEDTATGAIIGSVMGINHQQAFDDPDKGASLWCLAVSPSTPYAGVGESLVRRLAEHLQARGAAYMDLSVLHDNAPACALYEKLGFRRVPVFSLKRRNRINEQLFAGHNPDLALNPYARIVVDEARRRGIGVEIVDAEGGFFRLTFGGRSILCRESLSDLTSAVALSICDDKRITKRIVAQAGVRVPAQLEDNTPTGRAAFLERFGSVVVKPARGEQGKGISVGLSTADEIDDAIARARKFCTDIVVEEYFEGTDLRLIVIGDAVVATAIREPARIIGDGISTVQQLIDAQSRRRAAATGGESRIPIDAETERCLGLAGFGWDDIPPKNRIIAVRKTANLHTGGTITDVTEQTHPTLKDAALRAANAIGIPVTGIDLLIRDPQKPEYVFIEANERPGLANHEPQPTAERFIDLLFPLSAPATLVKN